MNKKDNHIVKSTPYAIEYYVHNASRGSDACRAAKGSDTSDPAAKAAVKRARADELLARLNKKLRITTEEKKRLELQTKMLLLLPKCSPQQPAPAACPLPAAATLARQGACQVLDAVRLSSLGGPPTKYRQPESSFPFKHLRTSSASALVAVEPSGTEEEARRSVRQQRFGEAVTKEQKGLQEESAVLSVRGGVGTNEALEKEYLRLTSLPRAADVRPPAVLVMALKRVKAKWLQQPDYAMASEQLKAIRQDLTVQHVRNALTVDVYETHGRLALESDDMAEFRRCHAVLRQLYGDGLLGNPAEFEAYGLLYTQATAAARNTLSLELSRVAPHLLGHSFVKHALDVCTAARSGNYARFIALYDGAPRMSPYIMDRVLGQMRLLALQSSVAAYKPLPLPLAHLAEQLGMETEEEAANLAEGYGAVVDRREACLDTRASAASLAARSHRLVL